jgi:hypothetical protein
MMIAWGQPGGVTFNASLVALPWIKGVCDRVTGTIEAEAAE